MAKYEHRPVLVNGTYIDPIPMEQGGKANYPFQMYPKMLYRAELADGGARICETKIIHDESQERMALGGGWSDGQQEAIDQVAAQQLEFAKLAANRAHNDRWMSQAAKTEAAEIDEQTMQHLPAIPETPIKKRGRPVKVTSV